MSKNSFNWAQGNNANVLEPIRELSESGWKRRDVPTASNMNWIFKQVAEELNALRKDLAELNELLSTQIAAFTANAVTEFESIKAEAVLTKRVATKTLKMAIVNREKCAFNLGVSRQICRNMRATEENIKHYHENFPTQPWPFEDEKEPTPS